MTNRYSNSFLQTYQKCGLQCFYKYKQHLVKIDDDIGGHHLAYGKAAHEAFAVLYSGGSMAEAKKALATNYPVQLDPNDLAKTVGNGYFMLEKYWEHYNGDKEWEIVEVEQMDTAEDGFVVKPDLVVKDRNSNLWIVDHKFTKKYLNYDYFSEFDPNSQVTQYIRWAKEKFGACDGFIINAVCMLFLKRKSAQRSAGFNVEFERQTFNRTPQQIQQDENSKAYWIERVEESDASGVWAMNTTACKFCTYRPLCAAGWDWENDSELILTSYRQVCDKRIGNDHCNLNLNHEGECDPSLQTSNTPEFEVVV